MATRWMSVMSVRTATIPPCASCPRLRSRGIHGRSPWSRHATCWSSDRRSPSESDLRSFIDYAKNPTSSTRQPAASASSTSRAGAVPAPRPASPDESSAINRHLPANTLATRYPGVMRGRGGAADPARKQPSPYGAAAIRWCPTCRRSRNGLQGVRRRAVVRHRRPAKLPPDHRRS